MKRPIIVAATLPTLARAQFTAPEVYSPPSRTKAEMYFSNPSNLVQLAILAALFCIVVLLLVRRRSGTKN